MANPPPPYDDITGISRTVMKDNAQESIGNYNGNARPGEIVVDLTTNPPTPYIGNNIGQLTLLTSAGTYGNIQVGEYLAAGQVGNIIPSGNAVYTLGNATNQWSDLYVSNATIYMNNVPVSLTAGNVLTVNGNAILSNNSDVAITTTGNVSASYFVGNGSLLTGISGAGANLGNLDINGTAIEIAAGATETYINISPNGESSAYVQVPNDATANITNLRIHNDAGNIEFGTNSGLSLMYLDTTGNLTMPNSGYINFVNTGGIKQVVNEDFYIRGSDDEEDGWSIYNIIDDGAGNQLTKTQLQYNRFSVYTDVSGNNYSFDFRDTGEFDVPKSIRGPVGGNLAISIGDQFGSDTFIDLQTRSYVGDALISNIRIANPNVTISTSSGAQNWTFGGTGNLTVPGNIQSISTGFAFSSGIVAINYSTPPVITTADNVFSGSETGQVTISGVNPPVQANGTWYYEAVATNGFALYLDAGLTQPVDPSEWPGYVDGGLAVSPGYSNVSITGGNVSIVSNFGETWTFEAGGALRIPNDIVSSTTIDIDNRTSGNTADIRLFAADDIQLQGRDKPDDSENEGGDINIYGGDGANAVTEGFDTGGGGDIQISGGTGGSDTGGGFGGSGGGTVNISSGDGGAGSANTNAGSGGSLSLTSGSAAGVANTALGGVGGSISITAGDTTRIDEIGGTISLNTGAASGDGTGAAGYVEINIPSSNVGPGGTWTFGGTGTTLNVPGNAEIYGPNSGNFTVGCAGNTIITSSDYGSNVKNWVFGYTGNLTLPAGGNIDTGTANANVALNAFSSSGNLVSIQAQGNTSSAVISIFSNAGPVTSNWTFTTAPLDPTESFLYVPPGGAISTPNATGGEGGKNIFIEAGAADQSDFYTGAGGELMLKGGRGAFNDGGGGGPGGNVNINAGESADPAGVAGNVYITAGALQSWVFDNTGNLSVPGNIIMPSNAVLTGQFASPAPRINGFDSIGAVNFSASGNISVAGTVTVSGLGAISIPNLPGFRVYGNGNTINLGNTVNTTGNLNINNFAVDYNQGSYLNTSTGVFTAPVAGLYSVALVARTSNDNNATSQIAIMKNGSTQQCFWEVSANSTVGHMGVSSITKLAVGDTLSAKVLLGTINFDSNDQWSVAFLG